MSIVLWLGNAYLDSLEPGQDVQVFEQESISPSSRMLDYRSSDNPATGPEYQLFCFFRFDNVRSCAVVVGQSIGQRGYHFCILTRRISPMGAVDAVTQCSTLNANISLGTNNGSVQTPVYVLPQIVFITLARVRCVQKHAQRLVINLNSSSRSHYGTAIVIERPTVLNPPSGPEICS